MFDGEKTEERKDVTVENSPLGQAMYDQDDSIQRLTDRLEDLARKLRPVMLEKVESSDPESEKLDRSSIIVENIRANNERINKLDRQVQLIFSALEV